MTPNQVIAAKRLELGVLPEAIALQLGISIGAYEDVEQYEHELYRQLSIAQVLRLGKLLNLDPFELLQCEKSNKHGVVQNLGRENVFRLRREKMGLNQMQLADKAGVEIWCVKEIEEDGASFNSKCNLEIAIQISAALGLPVSAMLCD